MDRLQTNLQRMLRELEDYVTGSGSTGTAAWPPNDNPQIEVFAQNIPLSHSRSIASFKSVCQSGEILSLDELQDRGVRPVDPGAEKPVELLLGTSSYVFTYAAPFRYPNTSCGLLFSVDVETQSDVDAIATPFDSGGIVRFLLPLDLLEDQTQFLRNHEMPVPAYRDYLARVIAWLFGSPWEYLSGDTPALGWPIQYADGDARRYTFEVRIPKAISIDETLLAAFMPVAVANQDWALPWYAKWKSQGVDIVLFDSPTADFTVLQRKCIDYLREHMES